MVEGHMLKDLPEDVILNISSFLLGTPQELKLKHGDTLKQMQKKYKFDIVQMSETNLITKTYQEETKREKRYGYIIRNKNHSI
jgi:hypothetical protein